MVRCGGEMSPNEKIKIAMKVIKNLKREVDQF
jgi:hypothetical protein